MKTFNYLSAPAVAPEYEISVIGNVFAVIELWMQKKDQNGVITAYRILFNDTDSMCLFTYLLSVRNYSKKSVPVSRREKRVPLTIFAEPKRFKNDFS